MKKIALLFLLSFATMQSQAQDKAKTSKTSPRVIILATGGTIAGSGESATKAAYTAGKVPIDDLLSAVPQIHDYGKITGEQIASIGSQDMNVVTWLKLSKRINEIFKNNEADAVVVTHGTDTQEETAYFLDLTVMSDKPVVLVGAMRPSTAMSQDGNRNLLDAVMVAANPKSQGKGVIVAMDEKIFDARDVTKTSSTNLETFQSRNFGPIGLIYDGKVSYYYQSLRNPSKKFDVTKLSSLPQVEIVYGYADASPVSVTGIARYPCLYSAVALGVALGGATPGNPALDDTPAVGGGASGLNSSLKLFIIHPSPRRSPPSPLPGRAGRRHPPRSRAGRPSPRRGVRRGGSGTFETP